LEHGDFWLSQTPDKPSKGWDATCCNRICSWGKFKEVKSGKTFYFFSVHFDHQGVEARRQSGFLMVQKIKEIAKNTPAIVWETSTLLQIQNKSRSCKRHWAIRIW
jgi:endonuclease/exonuclease/phosphatase family metal-dependent hydrolase